MINKTVADINYYDDVNELMAYRFIIKEDNKAKLKVYFKNNAGGYTPYITYTFGNALEYFGENGCEKLSQKFTQVNYGWFGPLFICRDEKAANILIRNLFKEIIKQNPNNIKYVNSYLLDDGMQFSYRQACEDFNKAMYEKETSKGESSDRALELIKEIKIKQKEQLKNKIMQKNVVSKSENFRLQ